MTTRFQSAQFVKLSQVPPDSGVSVISPASYANPDRVQRGLERLRTMGFAPRLGTNAQTRGPLFFAGTPEQRLADLHAAFADPDTGIVASVRGG